VGELLSYWVRAFSFLLIWADGRVIGVDDIMANECVSE
jgi:hypothetical protein